MGRTVEIPDTLNWPGAWSGNSWLDSDLGGEIMTHLHLHGHPSAGHVNNFTEMVNRWQHLWPVVRKALSEDLQCPHPIELHTFILDIWLPNSSIEPGTKWNIRFDFFTGGGAWFIHFLGWDIDFDRSGFCFDG